VSQMSYSKEQLDEGSGRKITDYFDGEGRQS
jgi:hypothetical protein